MEPEEKIVIGIDLGTYNSLASVMLHDRPVILKPGEGVTDQGMCFPSFVEFDEEGNPVRAGEYARRSMHLYPERVVWGVKRLIGKSYQEAREDISRFQYRVKKADDGSCRIVVGKKEYSPLEVSSILLKKIKEDAEAGFNPIGRPIEEAVITVPAYFGPIQKAQTEMAARMAGFAKVHLIPESTASALAYRLTAESKDQYIAVVDLGAGTLDVTVALLYRDERGFLQTVEKGHGGNTALGGLDFDDAILKYLVDRHRLQQVMKDPQGRSRLLTETGKAKIRLSKDMETQIAFTYSRGKVDVPLRRQEIEQAIEALLEKCRGPVRIALKEAGLSPEEISQVLLVGGPTMMPAVRMMVSGEFAGNSRVMREIADIERSGFPVNPMEAVATGAVLGEFGGITPHAYGILLDGAYYELIPRRQRYPCSNYAAFRTSAGQRSLVLNFIQKAVDPDSYQEVFFMLGIFQFDYCPEPGHTSFQIEAQYTDNGVLDLRIIQPSTMIALPLYSVSRLEGRKIPRPRSPMPIQPPHVDPPPDLKPASWTAEQLKHAIFSANCAMSIAQARHKRAAEEDRQKIGQIVEDLRHWLDNNLENIDIRTPQIGNLSRALLNALVVAGLIERQELVELQKNIK